MEYRMFEHPVCLSESPFAEIIDFFPDPCFAIDLGGKVIAWNQAMAELSGIEAKEMIGKGNFEYATVFYGIRRPMSIDLALNWDEETAKTYKSVKKKGNILVTETENPPFRKEPSLFWNKACKIYNSGGDCIGAIEVIRDMTEHKRAENALQHRLAIEQLVSRISNQLANIPPNAESDIESGELDHAIHCVLSELGEFTGVDRSYLFCFSDDLQMSDKTHEWCSKGKPRQIQKLKNLSNFNAPWWMREMEKGRVIAVDDIDDLPDEAAAEKKMLKAQNMRSVMAVPIYCDRKLFGFLGFDSVQKNKKWIDEDILLLRTISEIVGNTILRIQNEQALRQSENKFSKAFHNSPSFVYISDFETGEFLEANKGYCEMTGYPANELIGKTSVDLCILSVQQWVELIAELVRKAKVRNREDRIRTKTGEIRTQILSAALIELQGKRCIVASGVDITERKQAEEALRKSEAQHRLAIEAAQLGTWSYNPATQDVFCDKRSMEIFGLAPGGSIDIPQFMALVHPEDRSRVAGALADVLKRAGKVDAEYRILKDNGDVRWIKASGKAFVENADSEGRTVYVIGTHMDVTERKQSEEALRESEARLRALVDNLPFDCWSIGADGRYNVLNSISIRNWGNLLGKTLQEADIPLHVKEKWLLNNQQAFSGQVVTNEVEYQTGEGSLFIHEIIAPIRLDEKIQGILGINIDITDRIKNENALKESEKEKSFILESISDMVAYYDFELKLKWANKAWLDAAGQNLDAVLGRHCHQIWHNRDKPCSGCPLAKSRISGKPEEAEVQHGNGSIWYVRSYPVYNADGTSSAIVDFTRNITMQKRSEEAMKTTRDELDRKVRQRTAELEHRNREIRDLAHKTIQAMENDRRSLAKELHDSIGGTLAAIMYQLQSRVEGLGSPPPTVKLPIEKIISYLADTIQESRRITKQLRPSVLDDFGLVSAMEEHIKDFKQFYPKTRILQKISAAVEDLSIDAKTVLYRVLQEALNNVGRHSAADAVEIRCQRYKGWIRLKIKDNGSGFDVSHIYGNAGQIGGYGLHSMKERVEICKGKFEIDSAPGKGTTILAAIPLGLSYRFT